MDQISKAKKFSIIAFLIVVSTLIILKKCTQDFEDALANRGSGDILTVGTLGSERCGRYQDDWVLCKENTDCIGDLTVCGFPTTFNKTFKQDIDRVNACEGKPTDCDTPPPNVDIQKLKIKCMPIYTAVIDENGKVKNPEKPEFKDTGKKKCNILN